MIKWSSGHVIRMELSTLLVLSVGLIMSQGLMTSSSRVNNQRSMNHILQELRRVDGENLVVLTAELKRRSGAKFS